MKHLVQPQIGAFFMLESTNAIPLKNAMHGLMGGQMGGQKRMI